MAWLVGESPAGPNLRGAGRLGAVELAGKRGNNRRGGFRTQYERLALGVWFDIQ